MEEIGHYFKLRLWIVISGFVLLLAYNNCGRVSFQKVGGNGEISGFEVEIPPDVSSDPPGSTPPSTDPPNDDPPSNDPPNNDPPTTGPPSTDPPSTEPPIELPDGICKNIQLQALFVNIDSIEVQTNQGTFTVAQNVGLTNLSSSPQIELDVSGASGNISQIRLILLPEGNFVGDIFDRTYPLKTPSQQKTGLKLINIKNGVDTIEPGSVLAYLSVILDPATQIVRAGSKCLLKPVANYDLEF